jgi:hypothetical protein
MPQPLHRILSGTAFLKTTAALADKPELARWVAVIFANAASIEHYLSLMLVRILGVMQHRAFAI